MNIEFPPISVIDGHNWGIAFPVKVDGEQWRCFIEDEAIQDMFDVQSADLDRLKSVFDANRHAVEALVRERILGGETGEIRIYKDNV